MSACKHRVAGREFSIEDGPVSPKLIRVRARARAGLLCFCRSVLVACHFPLFVCVCPFLSLLLYAKFVHVALIRESVVAQTPPACLPITVGLDSILLHDLHHEARQEVVEYYSLDLKAV